MKETTITLKPYNYDCADDVYDTLFYNVSEYATEDGWFEIPAASYQIIVSALELFLWEAKTSEDREVLKNAVMLVERLRDKQKTREWKRDREREREA